MPLPRDVVLDVEEDAFELAIEAWFSTFGIADRALRYRIERDALVWSKPPLLGRIRFEAEWSRLPRAALARFDWRLFERGIRGTNTYESWTDIVFVAHDTSEAPSGHRFPMSDLSFLTTLLQWAHDEGVATGASGGGAYRASPREGARPLVVIADTGRVSRLAGPRA